MSIEQGTDTAAAEAFGSLIGGYVTPAFTDAHIHLLGFARTFTTQDFGASSCPTIPAFLEKLRASNSVRSSGWIVLRGFDDALVLERRMPTRRELDMATGDNPLRLRHRTGHASILNSAAFARLPALPPRATIEVDTELAPVMLVGAEDWLNRLAGRPTESDLIAGLRGAQQYLRQRGILRVWDATPKTAHGIAELRTLLAAAHFDIDARFMGAVDCLSDAAELPAGVIKLFPGDLGQALGATISRAHMRGARVAVHCTELSELDAALTAFEHADSSARGDRIEHATLCTRRQAAQIARLGLIVVMNPGWLTERRQKYKEQIAPRELRSLMPFRTILDMGCELAFGSDAPVASPAPNDWIGIASGKHGRQSISVSAALRAATGRAIWRHEGGTPRFIVLDGTPGSYEAKVLATCSGGQLTPTAYSTQLGSRPDQGPDSLITDVDSG